MGFRKSFKIAPGIRVNLSSKGVGVSAGVKGFRVGTGPMGTYTSVGIPGTGIYSRKYLTSSKTAKSNNSAFSEPTSNLIWIPQKELSKSSTSIGCLVFIVGFILLFIQPVIAIFAFIGAALIGFLGSDFKSINAYQKAVRFSGQGEYRTAVAILEEVKKIKPNVDIINLHIGLLYSQIAEFQKAIPFFEEYLKNNNDTVVQFYLAISYGETGHFKESFSLLQSLPHEFKQELRYINFLGYILLFFFT